MEIVELWLELMCVRPSVSVLYEVVFENSEASPVNLFNQEENKNVPDETSVVSLKDSRLEFEVLESRKSNQA